MPRKTHPPRGRGNRVLSFRQDQKGGGFAGIDLPCSYTTPIPLIEGYFAGTPGFTNPGQFRGSPLVEHTKNDALSPVLQPVHSITA